MLKVEFYETLRTTGKQVLCGYLYLDGDEIKAVPDLLTNPTNADLLNTVMDVSPKERKMQKENPAGWLRSLPSVYTGSIIRAKVVVS